MEKSLIDYINSNHFSFDKNINEKQIFSILDKKCSKNRSISLINLLNEIDETLFSDYVKEMERKYTLLEEHSRTLLEDIDGSIDSMEKLQEEGMKVEERYGDFVSSLEVKYDEIKKLEMKYKNLEDIERMKEIISNIQSALVLEDIQLASEQVADFIENLYSLTFSKKEICSKLLKYHAIIEERLIKLFEDCMAEIHWPFISNGLIRTTSQLDTVKFEIIAEKFSEHFRNLYIIELPDDVKEVSNSDINTTFMESLALGSVCRPLCLLLKPFVKYFRYFFWTESKVNKINKPEWYMTQVIQWISIHQEPLDHMFTTSLMDCIDVKIEFIRALVIIVMEKVHKDLELTRSNDDLYFHLIEESLTMTVELRKEFDYPESYPDLIDVICNDEENFEHWLVLEKKFAFKQLDEVFLSIESWRPLSSKCKRVECIESLIGLVVSIKERIECVSDVSRQSRFCQVLLEVLENFRLRLLQITKNYDAKTKRWYDIMNVVLGVKIFLRTWTLDKTFIEVYEYNKKRANDIGSSVEKEENQADFNISEITSSNIVSNNSIYSNRIRLLESHQLGSDSLFTNILSLFQHVLDGLETSCVAAEFEDLLTRAEPYIKKSWIITDPPENINLMSLSPSASGMMLVLRDRLHELDKALEAELFENVWQSLAHHINRLLFKEVILNHRFTEAGAQQLDFDIRRNLLPLFILYTKSPHRFFVDCLEACALLNLKWGTAMLIKELLKQTLHNSDEELSSSESSKTECPLKALNELGVFSLSPDVAECILDLRINPNLL